MTVLHKQSGEVKTVERETAKMYFFTDGKRALKTSCMVKDETEQLSALSFVRFTEKLKNLKESQYRLWWNQLSSTERDEYFEMYSNDMERMDLLRATDVDDLDEFDIEQIYNEYY